MPVQTYTVKGGDNLFSIAGNVYGDQRMFAEIMRLNNLGSGVIRPGMVLRLPAPKPSSSISVSPGLMQKVAAENQFVQQNKRLPSEQEIQQTMASTPVVSTNVDLLRQQRQERNMLMAEQAQQAPTAMQQTQSPYTAEYAPSYNTAMRGRGYKPITQGQFLKESAMGLKESAMSAAETGLGRAVIGGAKAGATAGAALGLPAAGVGAIPGAIGGGIAGGFYGGLGYAAQQLAPIVSGSFRQGLAGQAQAVRDYLGRPVDPATGMPIQTQQPQVQPQAQAPQAAYGSPAAQIRATRPATPQQLRSQLETVPIGAESALGLTRSTLTEQQIPSPASEQATDPAYLRQIGMTPAQINYFIDTLNKPSLTQQDADQFRNVFNIQPGSAFDNLIQKTIVNPVAPSTNEEVMGSIWQELQNTGGYGMPMEWIIGGGGGGGGGGGQGNKRSPYSIGGTATYGGF